MFDNRNLRGPGIRPLDASGTRNVLPDAAHAIERTVRTVAPRSFAMAWDMANERAKFLRAAITDTRPIRESFSRFIQRGVPTAETRNAVRPQRKGNSDKKPGIYRV